MNLVKSHTLFTKGAVYYNNITTLYHVYLNEEIGCFFLIDKPSVVRTIIQCSHFSLV